MKNKHELKTTHYFLKERNCRESFNKCVVIVEVVVITVEVFCRIGMLIDLNLKFNYLYGK